MLQTREIQFLWNINENKMNWTKVNENWNRNARKQEKKHGAQIEWAVFPSCIHCSIHIQVLFSLILISPAVSNFSVIVIARNSMIESRMPFDKRIFAFKWIAFWIAFIRWNFDNVNGKNHNVNKLKTFYDVYDDFITVKCYIIAIAIAMRQI